MLCADSHQMEMNVRKTIFWIAMAAVGTAAWWLGAASFTAFGGALTPGNIFEIEVVQFITALGEASSWQCSRGKFLDESALQGFALERSGCM